MLYGVVTLLVMFSGMPIAFSLGGGRCRLHVHLHARHRRSIRSRRMSTRRWPASPCCRFRCSSSRARPSASPAPAPICTRRSTPGCTRFRAAWASPTCLPARCSPPWPARARQPARPSAAPASRKCASAAIPAASPPASSPPAAPWASCCRRPSP